MPPSKVAKRLWSLLFLVIAGFYLYGLGAVPLVGPDEPRYAEVAREMLARRDLITPTLGGLPWFEKPPLLYWLMMASYRLFGINEFAARLGPALCGLLTAILVCWVATQVARCQKICAVNEQAALEFKDETAALAQWSVLALFSSIGTIVFSRAASFDIVVTMTLTGALTFFFIWQIRIARSSARIHACGSPASVPAKTNNDWRFASALLLFGFYFFVGLSLLAKGLIGVVLPFGVIGVYFLMRREWPDRSFSKSLLWGIPIAIATASVWYGPMIARHGGTFVDQFIVQHHFARFLTNKYHHRQPLYFYPLTLAWLVLPWTFLLAAAFVSARSWRWRGDAPVDRLRVFARGFLFFFRIEVGCLHSACPARCCVVSGRAHYMPSECEMRGKDNPADRCASAASYGRRHLVFSPNFWRKHLVRSRRGARLRPRGSDCVSAPANAEDGLSAVFAGYAYGIGGSASLCRTRRCPA